MERCPTPPILLFDAPVASRYLSGGAELRQDRRDIYGDNDKSSRKNVALRKRHVNNNKINRAGDHHQLGQAGGFW